MKQAFTAIVFCRFQEQNLKFVYMHKFSCEKRCFSIILFYTKTSCNPIY